MQNIPYFFLAHTTHMQKHWQNELLTLVQQSIESSQPYFAFLSILTQIKSIKITRQGNTAYHVRILNLSLSPYTYNQTHSLHLPTAIQAGRQARRQDCYIMADGRHLPRLPVFHGQKTIEWSVSGVIKQPFFTHTLRNTQVAGTGWMHPTSSLNHHVTYLICSFICMFQQAWP